MQDFLTTSWQIKLSGGNIVRAFTFIISDSTNLPLVPVIGFQDGVMLSSSAGDKPPVAQQLEALRRPWLSPVQLETSWPDTLETSVDGPSRSVFAACVPESRKKRP